MRTETVEGCFAPEDSWGWLQPPAPSPGSGARVPNLQKGAGVACLLLP